MNKKPGQGVRIGHPDSGFRPHKELDSDRLLTGIDYDFYQGDDNPQVSSGGHGLGTASVIMSGVNRSQDGDYVIGTAPYSELIPLRVTSPGKIRPAPVLTFKGMHRLRDAIDHAVAHECHVISISLGGFPSKSVKKALKRANKKGVIVLAAAGNRVRTVVWPARYSRAISVAGCNIERKPWVGSSRGKKVDVSAPAESVWKAEYNKQGKPVVGQSDGTSFAVATTAGVAALWLSYHGRDKLIARYGEEQLPLVFKKLLKLSCAHSPYLSTDKFGEGIVDAKALLEMELPNLNNDSLVDKAEDEIDENSLAEEVASIIGENEERVKAAIASHEDELYFHMAHSDLKDSLLPLSSTQRRNISNLSSKVGGERQNFSGGLLKILSAEIGIEAKK
jgi:thermitase